MKTRLLSTILLLVMSAAGVFGDVLRVGSSAPYSTITSALATAKAGDEIWVTAGTYREAELIIPSGVSVYGGFTGSETKLTERNFTANATILDGSGIHRVATVSGLLDGFTLRNGRTGDNGGGVLIKSGGTVNHCIAFANEAGYDGGAVFAEEGSTVKNTLLTGNRAGNNGAAMSGDTGYQAVNLTVAGNDFTYKPEIKTEITVPASLSAGERLDVAEPDITNPDEVEPNGSTILVKGWELDGHSIHMPYTVTYADNGKKLRFWAANAAGVGVSNEATLTVIWTVSSDVRLLTPRAVCEGTTLAGAGITVPVFSPAPADGATYVWYIDGVDIPDGLDYALQYTDNGRLLTCEVKNGDGSITGATTPAVRLAVMKAPEILFESKASLSIGDGEPLCLPTPVVLSNGSDLTAQGWKWTTDGGATSTDFNSCDKAASAMNGATVYYTAENACTAGAPVTPVTKDYITTLTVNKPVGEFLQTVTALCEGMPLGDGINFDDGDNRGDYYIGNTYLSIGGSTQGSFSTLWADAKATLLAAAHHANVLRFSYNAGRDERQMMLTVHAVPAITTNPVAPVSALCAGDSHTLAVEASGDNPAYQWERSVNSTDGADGDWSKVPGATTADCHLSADATAYYRCTVKATCADKSPAVSDGKLTSAAVKVIVEKAPRITAQPISQTVCGATGIDLEVAATDADYYEWYHNGTATGANAAKLAGVTAAGVYTCVVSKAGGVCGKVNSNPAMVTVAAIPTVSLGSSTGLTACQGDLVTLPSPEVETGGSVIVPEKTGWYLSTDPAQTPVSSFIAGNSDVSYQYKLTYKCPDATAETVLTTTDGMPALSITVTPAPTVSGTLVDVTKNSGEKVLQSEVVNDFALTGGSAQWLLGGTPVTFGVDGYKVSAADHEKLFSCVVTNACGATATLEQSPKGKLTVNSLAIVTHPQSSTKCEGEAVSLTITTENATGFQWYKDGIKKDGKVENTSNTHTLSLPAVSTADAGVYTCEVYGAGGLTLMSSPAVVTVNAKPQIVSNSQNVTVCKGSPVTLQVEAKGYDLQYSWQGITSGSSTVTVTPAATTTYTCTVKNSCKPAGETRTITVTVNTPVAITQQPKDQNECTYVAISVAATGTPAPGYKWYKNGVAATAADLTALTAAGTTPKVDGVFTCEVSNACGSVMSAAAVVRKKAALAGGAIAADRTTVCPGESATLTVKDVTGEDAQYKWTSGSAGGAVVGNSATLTVSPTAATTYYCTVSNSCGALTPKEQAIVMTAPPKTPTLTNGNSSSPDGTCEGDEVTLPVVNNKEANGYWKLNDVPKGNITKYKVHSADDKQVFRYVNVNACGQEAVSEHTYTLNVKQPARITEVITTSPVVFQVGAALNTKVTVPAANNADPAKSKWTLNGAPVKLTDNVSLTDDAARLTYSVDNGCTTGIGTGGVDETSTMVRVWDEPTFSNTGSTSYVAAGQLGFAYAYPSAPTVAMNNCTLVSQGWVYEGGNATAAFLNPAKAAEIGDNGKKIVWQVRYTIPGDNTTTRYKNSPVMGTLSPWDVPTLADNTGVIYAKQGTAWTFPNANATGTNITIKPQTWVYGNTDGTGLQPMPANADYATQSKKILYRKVEYTIPCSSTTITAYLPCRILFPWREPVMDNVTAVTWDRMCNTKSYTDNGRPLTRVNCNMYECTLKEENWKAGTKVIKTTDKPDLAGDDGKAITYNMTWLAPDGKTTGALSKHIATLETFTVPSKPEISMKSAKAGDANVQVIGVKLSSTYKWTVTTPPTDRYGPCDIAFEGDRVLAASDHDKNYSLSVVGTNKCGTGASYTGLPAMNVNLEATSRGKAYYSAVPRPFKALYEGVAGDCVDAQGQLAVLRWESNRDVVKRRGAGWTSPLVNDGTWSIWWQVGKNTYPTNKYVVKSVESDGATSTVYGRTGEKMRTSGLVVLVDVLGVVN